MYENCAFTGHRNNLNDLNLQLLDRVILNLVKGGTLNFYCGMAQGFDIAAAESVLNLKKEYPVKLYACIPFPGQDEKFTESNRIRYQRVLSACDGQIILSPFYYKGCMQARNRYLVESCDVVISYLRKKSGGTYYTVNYAKKCGVPIIEL